MEPIEFLKTIYIGDRVCNYVKIDGETNEIEIGINVISRVRSKYWDFYTEEDILNGCIVFSSASMIIFNPPGPLPNDSINSIDVTRSTEFDSEYRFDLSIDSIDKAGRRTEVIISIFCSEIYLLDTASSNRILK